MSLKRFQKASLKDKLEARSEVKEVKEVKEEKVVINKKKKK